jgi:ParB family chromosome partitioning protein
VSNHLRLLELDKPSLEAVRQGGLSMGHARALLAIANISARAALAADALRNDWSVREIERRARELAGAQSAAAHTSSRGGERPRDSAVNPLARHLDDLQKRLAAHLGTKVAVRPGRTKGSGKLVINFYSIDQFEGLLRRMDFEMEE